MKIVEETKAKDVRMKVCLDGVESLIEELKGKNVRIRERYRAGDIPYEEACEWLFRPDVVKDAARGAGWSFGPSRDSLMTCTSRSGYESLLTEYRSWRAGQDAEGAGAVPWLFTWAGARSFSSGFFLESWCKGPASAADKKLLFELLDANFVPAEFFSVPPDHMPTPSSDFNLEGQYRGEGEYLSFINCYLDIAPLLRSDDPAGRHFDLPLSDGGVVHMDITAAGGTRNAYSRFGESDATHIDWEATGWIEGYTTQTHRRLEFTSSYNEVKMIGMVSGSKDLCREDLATFQAHPIWEEFRIWEDSKREVMAAFHDEAFDSFLNE